MNTVSHNTGIMFIAEFQQNRHIFVYNVVFCSLIRTWTVRTWGTRLCYKPEERGFDSRLGHSNFSLT